MMPRTALCLIYNAKCGHRLLEGLYCYASVRTNKPELSTQKTSPPKSLLIYFKNADTRCSRDFATNKLVTDSTYVMLIQQPIFYKLLNTNMRMQSLCEVCRENR